MRAWRGGRLLGGTLADFSLLGPKGEPSYHGATSALPESIGDPLGPLFEQKRNLVVRPVIPLVSVPVDDDVEDLRGIGAFSDDDLRHGVRARH